MTGAPITNCSRAGCGSPCASHACHKGIRVTSATTLMSSHGRGARGAAVGLNSSRLVVTQVARTGKTIRLPMPAPAPHPSPRAAPHPTLLCLFNPDSTRSYQSTLSYRSSNVVHLNSPPMSFRAAARSLSVAPSSSRGGSKSFKGCLKKFNGCPK